MKVLWLVNVPLPEVSILMTKKPSPFGGWLVNAADEISRKKDFKLTIVFPNKEFAVTKKFEGQTIDYYTFPLIEKKQDKLSDKYCFIKNIIKIVQPDLVHIFGTEYAHSLIGVNVCNSIGIKNIVSIQGLTSIISHHYMANLPAKVQKRFTLRDFLKRDNLIFQQKKFAKRGKLEVETIKKTKHIIGRTTFDKVCTSQINQTAQYHFCNEILREAFYSDQWDLNRCEKHSIFTSQGSYPLKGVHFILEAMPLILNKFPKAVLYVAGHDIVENETLKQKLKSSSYAKYLRTLIKNNNLESKVIFTGPLDEHKMKQRYLSANVFVCPSSIENSPNSLSEAMILGVPSVVSHVGGVPDMIKHNKEGFIYQADAHYMLAHYISEMFEKESLVKAFSKNAREKALKTHDKNSNTIRLIEIYKDVVSKRG